MGNHYLIYSVTDFLTDDYFVTSQLHPSPESELFWQTWYANHPQKRSEYTEAKNILVSLQMGLKSYEQTNISTEAKNYIFLRIQETNQKRAFLKPLLHFRSPIIWAGAAAIIVLIGLFYYSVVVDTSYHKNLSVLPKASIEQKNTLDKPMLVHLPDGSAVLLAPKSKITYPENFEKDRRLVILSGEATFDISKDANRPFLVMANEVTTKVLGTRFNVKAFESMKEVVVSVQEGKVSVFKNMNVRKKENELKGVILLPNQQAIFNRSTDQYDKKLISTPMIVNANGISFEFNEAPLSEVFKRIEQAYSVEIVYNESLLAECQVTGTFENESLFQKLDIITNIIGGSYEVLEGKILINSKGCK